MLVALFEPEIPQNTGNIIRLCANVGLSLDVVKPLGFTLNDKHLKRAGLDYHDRVTIFQHADAESFYAHHADRRVIAFSTKATHYYHHFQFMETDVLLFGPESRGLDQHTLSRCDATLRLPMQPVSRSLNLANTVSIVVYEALRQCDFRGLV
ncbi:MAG: tRNA (uridine(34)/cytosine(34)/5-carboxymethylaminomethyluridine(34)-2'-O)-methyltransferase TrmL [Legionellales bacterium]|jgi:tRNA (cytidine/uridine-2'-O-)-methyltransferase|nr:tRNA (uridine(34)/cytosine(34)/5-carboxymethylaminomethyluridine(34)-2'-O)-methyltransferase TrmL [Legionellales bacterium]|tara:strand:+ start:5089 stop:5544 length:456 start_codon:yes stop_codon:yes gene_type:complete